MSIQEENIQFNKLGIRELRKIIFGHDGFKGLLQDVEQLERSNANLSAGLAAVAVLQIVTIVLVIIVIFSML